MPLTHRIPECHFCKFHTKSNKVTSLEGTHTEIPRNVKIMSSFFAKIHCRSFIGLPPLRFEFSWNVRRVMKIHCLQFKFNFAQKKDPLRSITKLEHTENINDSKSQVSNML